MNEKTAQYRSTHKLREMPFYDENTDADNINGSFNIFYIIKYIQDSVSRDEYDEEYLCPLHEMKYFKNMKNTEGGWLYALTKEFEDDFYDRMNTRGKIYDGTLKEMITEECNWINYYKISEYEMPQDNCPCVDCGWLRLKDIDCGEPHLYPTDLCYNEEIKRAKERNEILDVVIRPLQRKIKEMLNSPHNRRGVAFIEKQIEWAFEE